jgi:uncharacterized membrane protein
MFRGDVSDLTDESQAVPSRLRFLEDAGALSQRSRQPPPAGSRREDVTSGRTHVITTQEGTMTDNKSEVPVDLYIAAYSDPDAAQADWDAVKELARDKVITVDGLLLVSREEDGKIHVKDNAHDVGVGTALGAVGGLVVGLIFPPAFLASGVVGAGIGAGIGGLHSHHEKKEIKAEVEDVLPPGSSGIVALFEERWVADVDKALKSADDISKHEVDKQSVESVKAAAGGDA